MNENPINLNEIIAPAFYNVFWDILDGKHTYYDLYGGRGSTKSSFVGVMIPFLMMRGRRERYNVKYRYFP